MNASVSPRVTSTVEKTSVARLAEVEYSSRDAASMPPVDDATMRVTTGSSQTAVIRSRECFCRVNLSEKKAESAMNI